MSKLVITGAMGAFVAGVIFHIVIPGILGVVVALLVSGATILDPLYAEARIKTTWFTLGTVLIIQAFHTVVSATVTGGVVGFFALRLQSLWLYPLGALLSTVLHYVLFFLFAAGLSVFALERNSSPVWGISLTIATLVGPIIGLVSVFVVRR